MRVRGGAISGAPSRSGGRIPHAPPWSNADSSCAAALVAARGLQTWRVMFRVGLAIGAIAVGGVASWTLSRPAQKHDLVTAHPAASGSLRAATGSAAAPIGQVAAAGDDEARRERCANRLA